MIAWVFPGQGSQSVGMGKSIYDAYPVAREVFQEVDEVLKQNLTKIIFEGPDQELMLTENTQPALMTVSMAIVRVLQKEAGQKPKFLAGHSLGEYAAHAVGESFSLADTARLLKIRGKAMQAAVPVGVGGMAALLGPTVDQTQEIVQEAAQDQTCEIANDNCPGQVVISGHKEAIDRAIEIAKQKGIKRAVLLPVSAPFHCSLMRPAALEMAEVLKDTVIMAPNIAILANVSVEVVKEPEQIRTALVEQVTGRVRWRESILALKTAGVRKIVEIGAGKVLSGLTKRIDEELESLSLNTPEDLDAYIKNI
ncbi:ACP S-malonyltransferase [Candidatus Nucleicultrix amoebiphila]|jgi:[acyl-carrier-protein] S-malonyltransferase|uniref:Malonyl CoA-acyl carrier protein transacylase n=1 Tax=Candidatus Nucleicultrix amoebiphila FS5 TaxID=1414854 RepID=A0A1W6N5U1_9PROT|nr:ACP S-malonyltransferase [Candidatus Nucleicultrix amoebiphila]ARN85237.1 ACP S-malonyltransferase [Candidatus Nucleicultrix amoebiphila FS5]